MRRSRVDSITGLMGSLFTGLNWVPVIFVFIMMFLTAADVLGRYIFSRPIYGAQDVTELMLVVIVFFGIPYLQFVKGHIKVELLFSRLSTKILNNT